MKPQPDRARALRKLIHERLQQRQIRLVITTITLILATIIILITFSGDPRLDPDLRPELRDSGRWKELIHPD